MRQQGFTLVELIVTIAIAAILAALAAPSMNSYISNMRTKSVANGIYTSFQMAAMEANDKAQRDTEVKGVVDLASTIKVGEVALSVKASPVAGVTVSSSSPLSVKVNGQKGLLDTSDNPLTKGATYTVISNVTSRSYKVYIQSSGYPRQPLRQ